MSTVELFPVKPTKRARYAHQRSQDAKEFMTDAEHKLYQILTNTSKPRLPEAFFEPVATANLNTYHKFHVLQTLGFVALPDIPATDNFGQVLKNYLPVYASVERGGKETAWGIIDKMKELAPSAYRVSLWEVEPVPLIDPVDMLDMARIAVKAVIPEQGHATAL